MVNLPGGPKGFGGRGITVKYSNLTNEHVENFFVNHRILVLSVKFYGCIYVVLYYKISEQERMAFLDELRVHKTHATYVPILYTRPFFSSYRYLFTIVALKQDAYIKRAKPSAHKYINIMKIFGRINKKG